MNYKCVIYLIAYLFILLLYSRMIAVNGCGQCPQYVHVREILIVQVIS